MARALGTDGASLVNVDPQACAATGAPSERPSELRICGYCDGTGEAGQTGRFTCRPCRGTGELTCWPDAEDDDIERYERRLDREAGL